ncbi:hypothetical protein PMZ80_006017 [Knufia obscura]|uniref:Calcineurin-like phosphoesterase domain-containing protein n=2 Tax=Knufia TaxID=430999 RepID=A0AAN8EIC6_9EURO|nr:hypothetical protein PMZ80_006017 [Knufia obscura]KAK5954685.1 hypothetical protein OHC33_004409 [Knufia fluminis]
MSDLHLEAPKAYDIFNIVPKAPYLALLGDVGNVAIHKDDFLAFLTVQLKQFRAVLFVPGNHEAYHSNWPDTLDILRTFEKDVRDNDLLGEFVLLDRTEYRLPGTITVILGCSLFSFVQPSKEMEVSLGLNDFFQIDDWDISKHNNAHARDLAWLNTGVADLEHTDVDIMIFTHWSPSVDSRAVDPRHVNSAIKSGFSTDLSNEACFKSDKVKVWAFGHTHFNCDFAVEREDGAGGLRLVANQRGYYFAQPEGYEGEKIVEI